MKLIYAFDENTKNKLIDNGYSFLNQCRYKDKEAFLFINDGVSKTTFSKDKIEYSNKMYC